MGSLVEFTPCEIPDDQLDKAFKMPGGGPHNVGPGQVTDDSEMAMCMLWGLTFNQEKQEGGVILNAESIATFYKEWIKSKPFDIGNTTANALENLNDECPNLTRTAKFCSFMQNKESCSNGCLMRQTPMAVWASGLEPLDLRNATNCDVTFTHASSQKGEYGTSSDAFFIYNYAIKLLLENKDDPQRAQKAFDSCAKVAENFTVMKFEGFGEQSISSWIKEAKNLNEMQKKSGKEPLLENFTTVLSNEGWVKNPIVLSFYFLLRTDSLQENPFDYAMREIIRLGGDTDTNACIVGGMLGALIGFSCLNSELVGKILSFDCTRVHNINRPAFLSTKAYAVPLIYDLIRKRAVPGDKIYIANDVDPYKD